jgi:hypothetical protein
MSTEDKDLKYHLISPGMPEYEMVEDMANLIREYDIKNTALAEQYRQGAKELNDEYQPKIEELRRKVFALYTEDPAASDIAGTIGLMMKFFNDTGVAIVVQSAVDQGFTSPPGLASMNPQGRA